MFSHLFQIILNFMYVCQSVSLLTSLLVLWKYRDIFSSACHIFLKIYGDIPWVFLHKFKITLNIWFICHSVRYFAYLLILGQCRDSSCSGWDIFLKFYGDIPGIFLHYFKIISIFLSVCQSVSWPLPHWN